MILYWGRDRVVGRATCYGGKVWGSNSGGGKIFYTRPDRRWNPQIIQHNGHRIIFGRKTA